MQIQCIYLFLTTLFSNAFEKLASTIETARISGMRASIFNMPSTKEWGPSSLVDFNFKGALVVTTSLVLSLHVDAASSQKATQPLSPAQYENQRYHTFINNDFSRTDRFDLNNPVRFPIEIVGVYRNDYGYIELLFHYQNEEPGVLPEDVDRDTRIAPFHRATLQTTDEFSRLRVKDSDFKKGVTALVSGWPALPIQLPYSELLIDEIAFTNPQGKPVGQLYVFHPENERMVKYKDRGKPRVDSDD